VAFYSYGSCNEEELCPHGYGYDELCHPVHDELDGIDEQSTICNSDVDEEVDHCSIDNGKVHNSVKLLKTQKKNLRKQARILMTVVNPLNQRKDPCSQRM